MKKTISLVLVLAFGLATEVANADFTFGKPHNLGPVVNSAHDEDGVCISRDGLSLYLTSNRPGGYGGYDLYVATRETTDQDWNAPMNLGEPANSQHTCWRPSISNDGLSLYFSDGHLGLTGTPTPGGLGGAGDIWLLTRETTDDRWGSPVNVGSDVNSEHAIFPCISTDGLSLYFTSHRSGASGHCDLMVATRPTTSDAFGVPTFLKGGVNSSSNGEWGPDISADGLTLFFFHSLGLNILMARRSTTEETFGIPVELPEPVNTSHTEGWPSLSTNGSTLYFASNRPGGSGSLDLWQAPILPVVDFNGDGIVDSADMCIMVDYWHTDEPLCDIGPTPFGDGIVDVQDLVVLSEYLFKEVNDPTLVAHWALDGTEGDIASDSANDNDGNVYGDPAWQPEGGMVDGSLQLDGIDDYVSTPFVLNPADGKFSVFVWIKGGAPGQAVLSQAGGANWLCTDSLEGNLMTGLSRPAGGRIRPQPLVSEFVITDGNWHRIGLVWDGSHRTLYVDDIAVAEDAQTNLLGSENRLYIGAGKAMEPGSFWSGLIDDVRIYNRAVTP